MDCFVINWCWLWIDFHWLHYLKRKKKEKKEEEDEKGRRRTRRRTKRRTRTRRRRKKKREKKNIWKQISAKQLHKYFISILIIWLLNPKTNVTIIWNMSGWFAKRRRLWSVPILCANNINKLVFLRSRPLNQHILFQMALIFIVMPKGCQPYLQIMKK